MQVIVVLQVASGNFCKMNTFHCRYPLKIQRKNVAGASIAGIFKHHPLYTPQDKPVFRFSNWQSRVPLAWEMSMALVFSVYGTGVFQK